ncbi:probable transcription factor TDA9 isoform X3 [Harpegnathos saltator]|uniref:probable transcription factor TDA9 isoform X3 n=1 Tax=Harpegnathos saltator TaxID=610380 RepID=UPI0005917452|nr:probable transcription factor TDA9 isoform X3 [Harpegnathos saltator]
MKNKKMSQTIPPSTSISTRYNCQYCSYGTNRRDLLMRHEMIHREDKPFWCHECEKFFSRADHVKKHVARMHRGSTYDPTRIRRLLEPATHNQIEALGPSNSLNDPQQRQSVDYQPFTDTRAYHLQPTPGTRNEMYQAPTMQNIASGISLFEPGSTRRGQYSGGHNDSHTKNNSKTERSSVVGDCTPPEPPVFPALAQPIAQPCSSAEVQATNIYLSHEMVKSPATAMAYPTEEEKWLYRCASDINGDGDVNHDDDNNDDDNDCVIRNNAYLSTFKYHGGNIN